MSRKRLVQLGMMLALVLALALAAGVVAAQQEGPGGPGGSGGPGTGGPGGQGVGPGGRPGGPGGQGNPGVGPGGQGAGYGDRFGSVARFEWVEIIADETGLTITEIRDLLADGNTLAQIITDNGGSVDAVTDAAMTELAEHLAEAVEAGRITQAEADEILAAAPDRIDTALNTTYDGGFGFGYGPGEPGMGLGDCMGLGMGTGDCLGGRFGDRTPVRNVLNAVLDATGLSITEVRDAMQAGDTLADVLTANDVNVDTFVAGLLTDAEARLATAVENGRITQEQADERLAIISDRITEALNRTCLNCNIDVEEADV
jgi:hypothetical protein